MLYTTDYDSPIGKIVPASDGNVLTGLWFCGQKYFDAEALANGIKQDNLPIFEETKNWLDIYFSGKNPDFTPAIKVEGTVFQKEVWQILQSIPYGETITYGELADKIARQKGVKKMSAQAIGGAVGHNPIAIIIPCHRVLGAKGNLTGYAAGVDKKAWLLANEGVITNKVTLKAIEDVENGKNLYGPFDNVVALMEALNE